MKPKLTFLISLPRCGSLALSHLCASPSCITFHEGLLQKCFTVTPQGEVELNEPALYDLENFLCEISPNFAIVKNCKKDYYHTNLFITDTSVLMFQLTGRWDEFVKVMSVNFDLQFIVNIDEGGFLQEDRMVNSFMKLIPEKGENYWCNSAGVMYQSYLDAVNKINIYLRVNLYKSYLSNKIMRYKGIMTHTGSLDFLEGSNPQYQELYTETKINTLLNSYQSLTAEHLRETLNNLEQQ